MVSKFVLNEVSYHGEGAIEEIVGEVCARQFKKALICTDPDLMKFGVATKVLELLEKAKLDYELFTEIQANPTVANVVAGVEKFKQVSADYIIAIGGGSSIDTAKAIGIIINNPEFSDVVSLEGLANTKNKSIPVLAVPTTAGTAAEVTVNYVITDEKNHRKLVCVDANAIPAVAFVDSNMLESMPKSLIAATGMDALTHAIEGYITSGANTMGDMFHLKAIELIVNNLLGSYNGEARARENMALGQYIAGMGFSNVGLGAVHSMAHPLGALYDTPHGIANAIILPTVMEYNGPATGEKYREIARAFGIDNVDQMSENEYRQAALEAVRKLSKNLGIPENLKGIVKEEDIDFLAKSAEEDACKPGNPREINKEDFIKLYKSLI